MSSSQQMMIAVAMSKAGDTICEDYWTSAVMEFSLEETDVLRAEAPGWTQKSSLGTLNTERPIEELRIAHGCGAKLVWGAWFGASKENVSTKSRNIEDSLVHTGAMVRASKQKALIKLEKFAKKARAKKTTVTLIAKKTKKEEQNNTLGSTIASRQPKNKSESLSKYNLEYVIPSEVSIKRRNSVDTQDESEDLQHLNFLDFELPPSNPVTTDLYTDCN